MRVTAMVLVLKRAAKIPTRPAIFIEKSPVRDPGRWYAGEMINV